ncbi:MAG: mannose-6-phosphate isomerase, class I [Sphaerochaeta sp.]|jgi:mannose-6-phosphate isomerase|uniref:mannose-6-phosphate isomerase, class I n=1 Tax=unclassified Sphaerochaeta TaxID=2637943 RepID=UPI000A94FBA4|nr:MULTISPECIES: mannose-6-phosphate isomerase, class I [unclassified Sphaerochaeta]MCK9599352.1 mannose-6-phosphate isomerase, class I [Sphaerochaeta sp.]MDX9825499.1 mannose-6-phosphate isomerase, class I [Sphaerochaeta sp.]MEA4866410.1 mannose-6-phosphate isomerase, class I [Sphaerochaeta sp.]HBO36296.1 mannose-6-phosphate isomerase, class I [Sphaerochaeta sp.]HPE94108.1 mannose-6-phosphate isomerase, class I [Sphaerochaeta sp.]
MDIVQIQGHIKEYEWGNNSFIPALLSQAEDGKSKAELWFGTHPSGDAKVVESDEPLSAFLAKDSLHWFGQEHVDCFGEQLPLLLKVLAIDRPLSIQVHPTKAQAEEGWAKEELFRAHHSKELWNYKDPNRKAEVIYALTPITAMCGFRPLKQIIPTLKLLIPNGYEKHFLYLDKEVEDPDTLLAKLFEDIYTMPPEELETLISEYIASLKQHEELPFATGDGAFLESKGIVLSCYGAYPKDPGLFCPFLLHVKHLHPGEALYLEPRTLHAYVLGNGIELMSASDNVLRGGLTNKKVDVKELMKILEIKGKEVEKAPMLIGRSGRLHVLTPTEEFHLMVLKSGTYHINERRSIELLFVTEGQAVFQSSTETRTLQKGSCHVVAASLSSYTLEVEGMLFIADVPR